MPSAVVFDLFHTLVDPEPLKPSGFDPIGEVARLLDVDDRALRAFWEETAVEQETTPVDLVDLLQRSVGPVTAEQRAAIDTVFGVGKDASIRRPDDRIVAMLAELAVVHRVGVVSNCEVREVRCWPESPLAAHVHAFVASCDHGAMKPAPSIYRAVLRALGVEADTATYVANGSSDELGGARRAGFARIVHMNAFDRRHGHVDIAEQRDRAIQADVSVDSVDELVNALLS